jgi:RND family efflux transporter MFP subunit
MNMIRPQDYTVPGEIQRSPNRLIGFFLHFLLPLAALACGVAITVYLMKTPPEAQPRKRQPTATLVEVKKVEAGIQPTVIYAMGEIIAARAVELKPRVNGEVIEVDPEFVPGGYFQGGQTMLKIDPADYTLVIRQLESEAAKAESDLALEMGNQHIAKKEFAILNEKVSPEERSLILRQPQLDKLKASLAFAQARLDQARLDLARTEIEAPFNSVIDGRNVDTGAKVTESTVLANLVGTDTFWLRLTIPVEQLQWVSIPTSSNEAGSTVRIFTQGGSKAEHFRTGEVIRLTASLEAQGRMAQLLVKVDDPLCRKAENGDKPRLLLGSYVSAEIEGRGIASGIRIDRADIHDGNHIWLMDDEGRLDIRPVDIIFRNRDQVIVRDGLTEGERLVTSSLASPIAGIPLRLAEEEHGAVTSGQGKQQGRGQSIEGVSRVE